MSIFFDILIAILFCLTAIPAVILVFNVFKRKKSWESKHKKISFLLIIFLFLAVLLLIYGSLIEPRLLIVRQENIDIKKLDKELKIALVADFQVGPYKKEDYIKKVVDKILILKPDLVLIAGDLINNSADGQDETIYLQPLEKLAKIIPTYAVAGNHEYGVSNNNSLFDPQYRLPDLSVETAQYLKKIGVKYLANDLEVININQTKINLFGGDSYWAGKLNLSALKNRDKDLPTIVLVHNPAAIFDIDTYDVDLVLVGHTHGGQIRLPLIGPVVKVDSSLLRSWHKGWVKYNNTNMYVTSGAGETGVRSRLFNLPEIVLFSLK